MSVVGFDKGGGGEEQRGACVGDGGEGGAGGFGADGVAGGGEAPKALAAVDGGVCDVARILAVVDKAKVVGARGALEEIGGEERGVEGRFRVCEEGVLGSGGDRIDRGEGEAEEAVGLVGCEFGGDGLGGFDGLGGDGGAADGNGVGVDVTAGGRTVAVADGPGGACEFFGGRAGCGVVDVVVGLFRGGEFGGKDPAGGGLVSRQAVVRGAVLTDQRILCRSRDSR